MYLLSIVHLPGRVLLPVPVLLLRVVLVLVHLVRRRGTGRLGGRNMPSQTRMASVVLVSIVATQSVGLGRACTMLAGGQCICETAAGDSWDLTALSGSEVTTTGDTTGCAPSIVKLSHCSPLSTGTPIAHNMLTRAGCTRAGISCQGNWNYHFSICGNVAMPQAIGCTSSQTRAAYRIDDYPTPTSRWCEYMAEDTNQDPPAVTRLDSGLALTYTCAPCLVPNASCTLQLTDSLRALPEDRYVWLDLTHPDCQSTLQRGGPAIS